MPLALPPEASSDEEDEASLLHRAVHGPSPRAVHGPSPPASPPGHPAPGSPQQSGGASSDEELASLRIPQLEEGEQVNEDDEHAERLAALLELLTMRGGSAAKGAVAAHLEAQANTQAGEVLDELLQADEEEAAQLLAYVLVPPVSEDTCVLPDEHVAAAVSEATAAQMAAIGARHRPNRRRRLASPTTRTGAPP